jgi:hypothetical protein
MAAPVYCEATFHYHDGETGVAVASPVLDGRHPEAPDEFERCGFALVQHRSEVTDWKDRHGLDGVYRAELERFAVDFTGCDVAVSFPLIARSLEAARVQPDHAPIEFVHSDFTDDYGPMVTEPARPYRSFLDPLLADHGLDHDDVARASRLMVLQWWRNIGPVDADVPLAVCDAESVPPDRLIRQMLPYYAGLRLDFEIFAVRPPASSDRWFTFPRMTVDEVLVLRTYDSQLADAGRAFWTPHSAFRDPHVSEDPAHRRSSIEARALCIWR